MVLAIGTWIALSPKGAADLVLGPSPGLAPTAIDPPFVPNKATDVDALAPAGVEHRMVLKIATDMRLDGYFVVIDGWIADGELAEIRMWWLDPAKADRRSPFGSGVTRYVRIAYERPDDGGWRVTMTTDETRFAFDVQRHDDGELATYADVETPQGVVEGCRVTECSLNAKKYVAVPVGLKDITVTCSDTAGAEHHGRLVAVPVSG